MTINTYYGMAYEMVTAVGGKRGVFHITAKGERVPIPANHQTKEMKDFIGGR